MWDEQVRACPGSIAIPSLYALGDSLHEWASRVIQIAGPGPLTLVGSSVGGSCALEIARLQPGRIAALVLVGAKAAHRLDPQRRDQYVAALRSGGIAALWTELGSKYFPAAAPPLSATRGRALAMEQSIDDLIRGTEVFHARPDATDVVAGWTKPLVVIAGVYDGFMSVEAAQRLASSAPHGRLHLIARSGHFPNLDQPEAFNAILRSPTVAG